MSDPLKLVAPRVDFCEFIDPKTGSRTGAKLTRDGFLFLAGIFSRVGGSNAQSNNELSVDMFDDAGIEETKAGIYNLEQNSNQNPISFQSLTSVDDLVAEVNSLRDQLNELTKRLESIQQGQTVI